MPHFLLVYVIFLNDVAHFLLDLCLWLNVDFPFSFFFFFVYLTFLISNTPGTQEQIPSGYSLSHPLGRHSSASLTTWENTCGVNWTPVHLNISINLKLFTYHWIPFSHSLSTCVCLLSCFPTGRSKLTTHHSPCKISNNELRDVLESSKKKKTKTFLHFCQILSPSLLY